MKDAFWFQHDSNARNDVRLLELRAELGWEGYGLWWALIEQLRESADYRLSNDKLGGLAMGMGVPKKQLESLLALCFDLCLLDLEDGYFFAPALCRRMEAWDTKRAALAEAGKRGAARRWAGDKPPDAEPVPPQSPLDSHPNSQAIGHPNAGPMAIREENIREEKSTEEVPLPSVEEAAPQKKIEPEPISENPDAGLRTPGGAADVGTPVEPQAKKERPARFVPPTADEILAYMLTQRPHNPLADVERVAAKCFGYYSGNGWKVGRHPMKDWKGACQTFLADLPKLAAGQPALVVQQGGYNGAIGPRPSQVSTRAAAIAGADAMFDAVAAGQVPLAHRYP